MQIPNDAELTLVTPRLALEPIRLSHAEEFCRLMEHPDLHAFTHGKVPTLGELEERFRVWEKRVSPDKKEIWLNWIARCKKTGEAIAHFQAGVRADRSAYVAFVVGKNFQRMGYATEGTKAICKFLHKQFRATQVEASVNPRNEASLGVLAKVGFIYKKISDDGELLHALPEDFS